ncbi:MAG: class I SAM-dependent methyltransferase, partial [Nitrososphaeraceae archaeon]
MDPIVVGNVAGQDILDVACGRGRWGMLVRTNWWNTRNGNGESEPRLLIGVDIFLPFLQKVKHHKIYDDVLCCHVAYLPFRDKSFDTVLASEVIEHMPEDEGYQLLSEIERLARMTTIVTTPNILRKRDGLETPEGFNQYEQHITHWPIRKLRARKYRVRGVFIALPRLRWLF